MARPRSISDEQILEAAEALFMEQGMQATIAEIAARAGVSEGSVFRRFGTKEALFFAALTRGEAAGWQQQARQAQGAADAEEALCALGERVLSFFERLVPRMAMVMTADVGSGGRGLPTFDRESPPVQAIRTLTELFDAWQRRGTLRACDPEVLARMFIASMHHAAFCQHAGVNEWLPMPRALYVRGVVDVLLRGVRPAEPDATSGGEER